MKKTQKRNNSNQRQNGNPPKTNQPKDGILKFIDPKITDITNPYEYRDVLRELRIKSGRLRCAHCDYIIEPSDDLGWCMHCPGHDFKNGDHYNAIICAYCSRKFCAVREGYTIAYDEDTWNR
jgi:hypothetical protein